MPSPFPGMDPYIEGEMWVPFHTELAVEIARQLTPMLAPRYVARPEKRYLVENVEALAIEAEFIPDVGVRKGLETALPSQAFVTTAPLEMATILPRKVPQIWIAIRETRKRSLVTAIEFLSPTNKIGKGYQRYLAKRARILRSSVHLLEVDLNRRGKRLPMRQKLPAVPYFVFLSRAERRPITEIWPIKLDAHLPRVAVPLLRPDPDVPLDLQQAVTQVYDSTRYDLELDYTRPPEVPLLAKANAWADKLLRKAGKRA
jgi:hypothetical protein